MNNIEITKKLDLAKSLLSAAVELLESIETVGPARWVPPAPTPSNEASSVAPQLLASALDWGSATGAWRWLQTTDLLRECGMDKPSRADVNRAVAFLVEKNGGQKIKSRGRVLLLVPPIK